MRVDIPRIIAELERAGLSGSDIAAHAHVDRSTFSRWRHGSRYPNLESGLHLLALHQKYFPDCCPLETKFGLQASQVSTAESD